MRVLVTGAAGFIGSTLVDRLRHDYDVRAIDNFSVGTIRQIGDVTVEKMDCSVPEQAAEMVSGCDVVVHLAGMTGIPSCEQDPEGAARDILIATKYVTDAAVHSGVRKLLFSSTFAVYGQASGRVTERTQRAPIGMYGNLRAACEYLLLAAQKLDGLNTLVFRQTNVYGKGITKKQTLLNILTDRVRRREPMTMYGSGNQARNFLHVLDTVTAYELAIRQSSTGVYNLGSPETLTVREVIRLVNDVAERVLGYRVPVETKKDRGGGNREISSGRFTVEIGKVQRDLGFEPRHTIRGTVEDLLTEE